MACDNPILTPTHYGFLAFSYSRAQFVPYAQLIISRILVQDIGAIRRPLQTYVHSYDI